MTKEDVEDASGEGEWELERLLLEWGKSGHRCLRDKPRSKLD